MQGLHGLTGAPEQLKAVANQYRVRYVFVGKGETERYTLDHSANLYSVDTNGRLFRILQHGLPPEVLEDSLRSAVGVGKRQERFSRRLEATGD